MLIRSACEESAPSFWGILINGLWRGCDCRVIARGIWVPSWWQGGVDLNLETLFEPRIICAIRLKDAEGEAFEVD